MREYYCEKVILRKNKFPNYMHEKKSKFRYGHSLYISLLPKIRSHLAQLDI